MFLTTLLPILIAFNSTLNAHAPCPNGPPTVETFPSAISANMPAPSLSVDTWVKGEEVKSFDPQKVYVVEFWATWCGPCLASIPHLTQLQMNHPNDLVVIGVAASERPDRNSMPSADESVPPDVNAIKQKMLEKVQAFVSTQGDKMNYRVAFDIDATMSREWMIAAKQRTIPCAFLVGKGAKIIWVGNPKFIDEPLLKALAQAPPKVADEIKSSAPSPSPPTTPTSEPTPPSDKKPAESNCVIIPHDVSTNLK